MSAPRNLRTTLLGVVSAVAMVLPAAAHAAPAPEMVELLVRPATTTAAVQADVLRLGGQVTTVLTGVGLVQASVPQDAVASLEADSDVRGLSPAAAITFSSDTAAPTTRGVPMSVVRGTVGADKYDTEGIDGRGIDIALIDTGIADLPALAGNVKHGIDLSFDAGNPTYAGTDGYGHGTHLAGIMVGQADGLQGVATGARLIDVRVGDHNGSADVSQVIAAIDWTIQHAQTDGNNIRVINLAFATPSTQSWTLDPLTYAAEAAWRNGIVVVASGGNDGHATSTLGNPAMHPLILAVGATDTKGTVSPKDDEVASFSQRGHEGRGPDVVAPGRSLLSIVPAGSRLAQDHPDAFRGDLFVGSGTSQSAAVTSGSVALLLQAHPTLTPDEVKAALRGTAMDLLRGEALDGAGRLDVGKAMRGAGFAWGSRQKHAESSGSGSLEASRGGRHVELVDADGNIFILEGEQTFTGSKWTGSNWSGSNWSGSNWSGSNWSGSNWTGSNWSGSNWTGSNWTGSNWTGSNWSSSIWGA